jgi:hypothetical protein
MSNPLPFLKPVESVLSLTPEDRCLEEGQDSILIPPRTLEGTCFLTYQIIRQSVYVGTHILDHLLRNPPGNSSHLASLMLYRHALEIGDSISTLLRFGSPTTASILERSLFETSLGLEFILEKNTFHEDRAFCYQAFNQIERFKTFTRYDPATPEGRELHFILDADKNLDATVFPRKDLSKERQVIVEILNSAKYKSFWDKFKAARHKPKHWYSLCSTASDIRSLARLIGRESEYVLLYKVWSQNAHAADVFSGVLSWTEERTLQMHKLRGPVEKIKETTSLTANYLVRSHNLLLETYLKGHDIQKWFTQWYVGDYRSGFMWAISPTPLFSEPPPAS